jgi:hypothetical protein
MDAKIKKLIQEKIQELMSVSEKDFNEFGTGWQAVKAKLALQDKAIDELKELAKTNNTLLGRIIKFPHADSYAMYVITKVNKKYVRIDWLDYCDGWVDERCGKAAFIEKEYALQKTQGEDALSKLFS